MKITDLKVREFCDDLASNKPVPGGGSVSALSAAQGISLGLMVASLTTGRKKYAAHEDLMATVLQAGEVLRQELLALVHEDSQSYALVMEAFALPKESDTEKETRKKAIHEGLIGAASVPFKTMEKALQSLEIIESLLGKSNTNAASDLGVSAIQLHTAIQGAWLNVLINITGMEDERASNMHNNGIAIVTRSKELSKKIYDSVKESLLS